MELTTPSESLLLITVARPLLRVRWYFIGAVCIWMLLEVFRLPLEPAGGGLGVSSLIGFIAFVMGLLLLLDSFEHPVQTGAFDTATQQVTLTRRVLWRAWRVETLTYSLHAIAAVQLYQIEINAILELALKDGVLLKVGTDSAWLPRHAPPHFSDIAETLSQFLNVPLRIKMGAGWVEKQPGHQA